MVAPGNMNEKLFAKLLLENLKRLGVKFEAVLADAQYNSSKVKNGLKVGKDLITRGIKRLVKLFRKRVNVERMFGRAKEWLLLDHLRVRGVEQAFIPA